MTTWHESDTADYSPVPAKLYIASRAAADAIYQWLERDCDVSDDELIREVVEDMERGWMDPMVEA